MLGCSSPPIMLSSVLLADPERVAQRVDPTVVTDRVLDADVGTDRRAHLCAVIALSSFTVWPAALTTTCRVGGIPSDAAGKVSLSLQ